MDGCNSREGMNRRRDLEHFTQGWRRLIRLKLATVRDVWRGASSSDLSMNVGADGVIDRRHLRSHSRSRKVIQNIASSGRCSLHGLAR